MDDSRDILFPVPLPVTTSHQGKQVPLLVQEPVYRYEVAKQSFCPKQIETRVPLQKGDSITLKPTEESPAKDAIRFEVQIIEYTFDGNVYIHVVRAGTPIEF